MNYCIRDNYAIREVNDFFDDTPFKDEFQDNVYKYAREVLLANTLYRVLDIGCGSGFKLLKYFSGCQTLGLDLPPTVEWLRKQYRHRKWEVTTAPVEGFDLIICSDVIEHIVDPDKLLNFIELCHAKRVVLSTPDRDHLVTLGNGHSHDGPPRNVHHVREWSAVEFKQYISTRFDVVRHVVADGTQIVECTQR